MITQKHLLDRLELFICPCRNKSRNTVRNYSNNLVFQLPTCGGKWRPELRIRVRKTRRSTFAVAWTVTPRPEGVPSPTEVLGRLLLALRSPASEEKRASLSATSFSAPYLTWSVADFVIAAAVLWTESKRRVTALASWNVRSFSTLNLHFHFPAFKVQKWDSSVHVTWGGNVSDLGWLLAAGLGWSDCTGHDDYSL